MMKIISTQNAPAAIGPYSQAIAVNGMLFASGQIPLDPKTGTLVEGGIEAQTERVMQNIKPFRKNIQPYSTQQCVLYGCPLLS